MADTVKLVEIDHFREKLIEMSEQLRYCANVSDCSNCRSWDKVCENQCVDNLLLQAAELLDNVANGVTVQEWISVKERLPEMDQEVIVYTGKVLKPSVFAYHFWHADMDSWARVTHWMPLPDAPKGE